MIDLGPSKRSRQPLQVDRSALRGHARPIKKRRNKKRLKKLEGGFDLRNVKDTTGTIEGDRNDTRILGKYDALTDDYCVFARGDTFRRHFTEMVGSNSLELLQQSRPRMDKPLSRLIKTPDVSSSTTPWCRRTRRPSSRPGARLLCGRNRRPRSAPTTGTTRS